jgi:hypothetical protein
MLRTQIQLTEEQQSALRNISAETGKSMAELVREGIDYVISTRIRLNREEQIERAIKLAGMFSSATKDGSTNHDRYFADSIL